MNAIPKRTIKLEECCENQTVVKKTINQNDDLKKKHIDKITKIIERSNAFVNELMTRRQNENRSHKYTTSSKLNASMFGNENVKKLSKDAPRVSLPQGSPSKRLRVTQKKK